MCSFFTTYPEKNCLSDVEFADIFTKVICRMI